jgi:hypothetical protein
MLALLSPLFGILGSLLPSIVRMFERKQEMKYEIELTKVKLDAALQQGQIQFDIESIKADVDEGKSVRDHDSNLDGGKLINALRASIRPVITYIFFFTFIAVKVAAAWVMLASGQSVPEMLNAVWDAETMSLFATIIAFWFGSRVLEKMDMRVKDKPKNIVVKNAPVSEEGLQKVRKPRRLLQNNK